VAAGCGKTVIEPWQLDACRLTDCPDPPDIPWTPPDLGQDPDVRESSVHEVVTKDEEEDHVQPTSPEKCNGKDDDGDGKVDEAGAAGCKHLFIDADKDNFGGSETSCLCAPAAPYSALVGGDCDDIDPAVKPGGAESCFNLADDDCDGEIKLKHCEGKTCGPDGCGGSCGTSCPQGTTCNFYGQCVSETVVCYSSCHCPSGNICTADHACKPKAEVAPPYPYQPCCSDLVSCLPAGIDCARPDGSIGECTVDGKCAALTCGMAGAECGTAPDGCTGMLECGSCSSPHTCGGEEPGKCGPGGCSPLTCADLGAECGTVADGCGSTVYCGTCDPGVACGASSVPNKCSSAPSCEQDKESEMLQNGEKYYYDFDPGEVRYFFLSEKSTKGQGNKNPLSVDVVDMTTGPSSNVDLIVKYVGFACEFAKPTKADHKAAVDGELTQGEGGVFFGVGSTSLEMIEIPDNPEGYFYVMVLNVGDAAEKKMRIGYSDPDSY